jgi:phosphoglycerate dehydrogenase-like enzyme
LAGSDHVVLSLPLTAATRNLFDAQRVSRIKLQACFYNVARGGIVDEDALVRRLKERSLRGALVDVFAQEPLPPDNPFWSLDNALITPHMAGQHGQLPSRVYDFFLSNLDRYISGCPLLNVANFSRGY